MEIKIRVKDQSIAATLIKPENLDSKNPALIFVHGWKSNQAGNIKRATEVSKLGFVCLTIDLRGHGKSDGKIDQYSCKDHLEDIKTAYEYLLKLPEVDPKQIGIIGSSYGGNLSAVAANFIKFKWLVLRVPALYIDKYFDVPTEELIGKDEEGKAFKSSDATPETSSALKGVVNFKGKILIVESEKDVVIPHAVIENYLKFITPSKLTYKVMKDAAHSLETEEQEKEYIEILMSFLRRQESN